MAGMDVVKRFRIFKAEMPRRGPDFWLYFAILPDVIYEVTMSGPSKFLRRYVPRYLPLRLAARIERECMERVMLSKEQSIPRTLHFILKRKLKQMTGKIPPYTMTRLKRALHDDLLYAYQNAALISLEIVERVMKDKEKFFEARKKRQKGVIDKTE